MGDKDEEEDHASLIKPEEEDDKNFKGLNIRTAGLDEKAAALHLLGTMSEYIPIQFSKYVHEYTALLKENSNYFHENVTMQVAISWSQHIIGIAKHHYLCEYAKQYNQDVNTINLKLFEKEIKFKYTNRNQISNDALTLFDSEVLV